MGAICNITRGNISDLAAALTLFGRNDLHDIADTAFPLIIIFWIALRNVMVKATPTD